MTETQKRTAWAIVNVFETGTLAGRYGAIARTDGDPGRLSYGRSQASLASGGLYQLAGQLLPVARRGVQRGALSVPRPAETLRLVPGWRNGLCGALEDAGADPVMHRVQDQFFEADYFDPALGRRRGPD